MNRLPFLTLSGILFCFLISAGKGLAQSANDSTKVSNKFVRFLLPAEQPSKFRTWALTSTGAALYSGVSIALDQAWYAQYPRSSFHTINDFGGWHDVDKAGHLFTSYFESKLTGQLYRWAGQPQKRSAWLGFGAGMLFQTTLETFDGFSAGWGWSWGDMAFNTAGSGIYLAQELAWKEQRVSIKMSTHKPNYSNASILSTDGLATSSARERTTDLFGTGIGSQFVKEYNGHTIWASVNLHAFAKQSKLPTWLNVAVGYGAENMYGANSNTWKDKDGHEFRVDLPRYGQIFLSPDIDFTRIKTKSKILKSVFWALNFFKMPAPTLEFTTQGNTVWHWVYF